MTQQKVCQKQLGRV